MGKEILRVKIRPWKAKVILKERVRLDKADESVKAFFLLGLFTHLMMLRRDGSIEFRSRIFNIKSALPSARTYLELKSAINFLKRLLAFIRISDALGIGKTGVVLRWKYYKRSPLSSFIQFCFWAGNLILEIPFWLAERIFGEKVALLSTYLKGKEVEHFLKLLVNALEEERKKMGREIWRIKKEVGIHSRSLKGIFPWEEFEKEKLCIRLFPSVCLPASREELEKLKKVRDMLRLMKKIGILGKMRCRALDERDILSLDEITLQGCSLEISSLILRMTLGVKFLGEREIFPEQALRCIEILCERGEKKGDRIYSLLKSNFQSSVFRARVSGTVVPAVTFEDWQKEILALIREENLHRVFPFYLTSDEEVILSLEGGLTVPLFVLSLLLGEKRAKQLFIEEKEKGRINPTLRERDVIYNWLFSAADLEEEIFESLGLKLLKPLEEISIFLTDKATLEREAEKKLKETLKLLREAKRRNLRPRIRCLVTDERVVRLTKGLLFVNRRLAEKALRRRLKLGESLPLEEAIFVLFSLLH